MLTPMKRTLLASAIAATCYATPLYADDLPEAMQQGNVTYVTGGIGEGEADALKAAKKDYNLHIMNVATGGAYVSDTNLVISDKSGNAVLTADAGPFFYAKLPSGKYTVTATHHEQTQKKQLTIPGKASSVTFTWKSNWKEEE